MATGSRQYPLRRQPLYLGATEGAVSLRLSTNSLLAGNTFRGNVAGFGAGLYLDSLSGIGSRTISPPQYFLRRPVATAAASTAWSPRTRPATWSYPQHVENTATHWIIGEQGGAGAHRDGSAALVANNILAFTL
jgi:hypothetical protein